MFKNLVTMLRSDDGQGLVEYALIIALVSVVAIAALTFLGSSAKSQLNSAASAINAG
jgi:pilus assembly protein Flp/PilA